MNVPGQAVRSHRVAKTPQSPSTICLAMRDSKSKSLSNWSVSVRGYDRKPFWYKLSAIYKERHMFSFGYEVLHRRIFIYIKDFLGSEVKESGPSFLQLNRCQRIWFPEHSSMG